MVIWTGPAFWSKNFFVNPPCSGAQPHFSGQVFCRYSDNFYKKGLLIFYQKSGISPKNSLPFSRISHKKATEKTVLKKIFSDNYAVIRQGEKTGEKLKKLSLEK
jgi:hypothetical protein